ncbi:MAG: transposase [Phycisphaerae bacterium]
MPEYRRNFVPGGTFFFTLVTWDRQSILIEEAARAALHRAFDEVHAVRPFAIEAIVLLPNHVHTLWTLPKDDADFSTRWQVIKAKFSRRFSAAGGQEGSASPSRVCHGERAIWQRRFWEHTVRDEREFEILCHYIHYNPVKHGHAACPHSWPYSSFQKFVNMNRYEPDWNCVCSLAGKSPTIPDVPSQITGE